MAYLPTFGTFYGFPVGKYTSPMDGVGLCLGPFRKSGLWPLAWELLWEMPKKQLHQEKANIDESNGYRY